MNVSDDKTTIVNTLMQKCVKVEVIDKAAVSQGRSISHEESFIITNHNVVLEALSVATDLQIMAVQVQC